MKMGLGVLPMLRELLKPAAGNGAGDGKDAPREVSQRSGQPPERRLPSKPGCCVITRQTPADLRAKASQTLDRSENTAEILDYGYVRQRELLQGIKLSIADVVTAKKRLELQQAGLETSMTKLEGQARMALAQNREDLARAALERKSAAHSSSSPWMRRSRSSRASSRSSSNSEHEDEGERRALPGPRRKSSRPSTRPRRLRSRSAKP